MFTSQTTHVGEVPSPAARPEDAVIEQDVRVDVAGKDHAGHQQIGAHDAHAVVARAQAMRELLRKDDERSAVAAPGEVKAAGDQ